MIFKGVITVSEYEFFCAQQAITSNMIQIFVSLRGVKTVSEEEILIFKSEQSS